MYQLADFARAEGAQIDALLREKIKYLRFSFDKFAGDQSGALFSQLFESSGDLATKVAAAAQKLKADPEMAPVGNTIETLCALAAGNRLTGSDLHDLARLAGEAGAVGDFEPLLDPRHIVLTPIPTNAFRKTFQLALARGSSLTQDERDTFELFVAATSNIEQLLSDYFARYCVGTASDRKVFLYLAWMLWAFLRSRSSRVVSPSHSIYSALPELGGAIVTFNYTNFFQPSMLPRVHFFHGRLDHYLRVDTRDLIVDDQQLRDAIDVSSMVPFFKKLRLDVQSATEIDMPAIVPPIAFKPVMSREQLRVWADVDDILQSAQIVVVVGYSFAQADEHFNDLLRKGNPTARVVVVNSDALAPARSIARILRLPESSLRPVRRGGFDALISGRLTFIRATAEDVGSEFLRDVLD